MCDARKNIIRIALETAKTGYVSRRLHTFM